MATTLDAQGGRAPGSRIIVEGRVLGIRLFVEEVVTVRQPPGAKEWETIGRPRLLVIGPYRMRFTVKEASADSSAVVVSIDYDLPAGALGALLGRLFGPGYARWCTHRMAGEAQAAFAR